MESRFEKLRSDIMYIIILVAILVVMHAIEIALMVDTLDLIRNCNGK